MVCRISWAFCKVHVHVDIDHRYILDVSRNLGNWNPILFFSVNRIGLAILFQSLKHRFLFFFFGVFFERLDWGSKIR